MEGETWNVTSALLGFSQCVFRGVIWVIGIRLLLILYALGGLAFRNSPCTTCQCYELYLVLLLWL